MATEQISTTPATLAGRYVLGPRIASGGMATVYVGQVLGAVGFTRLVAIKRLHQQYVSEPEFVSMMIDEARLSAMIRHPNVVPTLDVVADAEELFIIMEYVEGLSLSRALTLARGKNLAMPVDVAVRVVSDLLHGLDAAHEALDENGQPLGVVHRDVSPQNVMVGIDGVSRVIDFGIAKAAGRVQVTREGQIKGKLAFMAPEQLLGKTTDCRADIYGAAVILWELLVGERPFLGQNEGQLVTSVLRGVDRKPSSVKPFLEGAVDDVIMRGLEVNAEKRFPTAREFALAIEDALPPAKPRAVADWLKSVAGAEMAARREALRGGAVAAPPSPSFPGVVTPAGGTPSSVGSGAAAAARALVEPTRPPAPADDGATETAASAADPVRMTREAMFSVLSGNESGGSSSNVRRTARRSERDQRSSTPPAAETSEPAPDTARKPAPAASAIQSAAPRNITMTWMGVSGAIAVIIIIIIYLAIR